MEESHLKILFSYLPISQIDKVKLVCKKWQKAANGINKIEMMIDALRRRDMAKVEDSLHILATNEFWSCLKSQMLWYDQLGLSGQNTIMPLVVLKNYAHCWPVCYHDIVMDNIRSACRHFANYGSAGLVELIVKRIGVMYFIKPAINLGRKDILSILLENALSLSRIIMTAFESGSESIIDFVFDNIEHSAENIEAFALISANFGNVAMLKKCAEYIGPINQALLDVLKDKSYRRDKDNGDLDFKTYNYVRSLTPSAYSV